jgi:RNA polymerase sigma-70 factor (ECF subfamily)
VLDTLNPAERLSFVLHDIFQLPFEEIAPMVDRTPAAARQLASRARRRIQSSAIPSPDPDRSRQRAVVDAFFSAARGGEFDTLLGLLDPEIVLRADFGAKHPERSVIIRGAAGVARSAIMGGALAGARVVPVLVNGAAGAIIVVGGRPFVVMGFIVADGRILEIDAIADPGRVRKIAAPVIGDAGREP